MVLGNLAMIFLGLEKRAHQTNTIDVRIHLHVFNDISIWHPLGHHLEWIKCDAETWEDVRMVQPCPCHNLPIEFLGNVNQPWFRIRLKVVTHFTCLLDFRYIDTYIVSVGSPLKAFQLPCPYPGRLVHLIESVGNNTGAWNYRPMAANSPYTVQCLLE